MAIAGAPSLIDFAAKLALRAPLCAEVRAAILQMRPERLEVAPHRAISRQGAGQGKIHILVEGFAGCFSQFRDGRRATTSLHLPGDALDLPSLFLRGGGGDIEALTHCLVARLPAEAFAELFAAWPGIARACQADLAGEAAIRAEWVASLGRRIAEGRLAHLLCEMAARLAGIGRCNEESFPFPLTQTQVADALGLTPVHLNRVLRSLRDQQIVRVADRTARVLSWPRLRQVAEFDPDYLHFRPNAALASAG